MKLDEVFAEVQRLARGPSPKSRIGAWTPAQAIVHCAESLECNLDGFPEPKSPWFQATVGRAALKVFLTRGRISHDVDAPVPGLPVPPDVPLLDAVARLGLAIERAKAAKAFAPHAIFGGMSKSEVLAFHAMHLEDHLRDLVSG